MKSSFKYLDSYVKLYKETKGYGDKFGHLPKLVVYFRIAFDALNTDPVEFFGWDEETAEDFYTWGHNSRWANTFNVLLFNNLEEYVDLLKDAMIATEVKDFEVKFDED